MSDCFSERHLSHRYLCAIDTRPFSWLHKTTPINLYYFHSRFKQYRIMTNVSALLLIGFLLMPPAWGNTKKNTNTAIPIHNVVNRAHQLIGTPYAWGGSTLSSGFDCSGLLVYLFKSEAKINLPRTTAAMRKSKAQTVKRHQLKAGDAVFFKHNGRQAMEHVGLYIGGNRFIHSPRKGKTIRIDSIDNTYWNKSFVTAKRFHANK